MSVIKIPYGSVKEPDIEMTAVEIRSEKLQTCSTERIFLTASRFWWLR